MILHSTFKATPYYVVFENRLSSKLMPSLSVTGEQNQDPDTRESGNSPSLCTNGHKRRRDNRTYSYR